MESLIKDLEKQMLEADSMPKVAAIRKAFSEKYIFPLKKQIAEDLPLEEKKKISEKLEKLSRSLNDFFRDAKDRLSDRSRNIKKMDLSVDNPLLGEYSFNPLMEIKKELINLFNGLNFSIESGREIVSVEENFEALCIAEDHPSRSNQETFYLDEERILRPHCTVNSVFSMSRVSNKNNPVRIATIGSVYRKDDEGSRHVHQFSQLDFVWIDKNLNMGNLKWLLKVICDRIFGKNQVYRFRNSYFPFTQPSLEMDMKCICGDKSCCSICRGSGWIEILGAGIFRKEILERSGYFGEFEGIAGGVGLERLALIKYQIKDIRHIYENNFLFLENDS